MGFEWLRVWGGLEREELIARRRRNPCAGEGLVRTLDYQEGAADTRVALVAPRIAGDLKQRLGAGPEQQGIDLAFIHQRQWRKLPRQRKDHVDAARGQQFFTPRLEPAVASVSLALRAMPVPAGNGEISITCLMGSIF